MVVTAAEIPRNLNLSPPTGVRFTPMETMPSVSPLPASPLMEAPSCKSSLTRVEMSRYPRADSPYLLSRHTSISDCVSNGAGQRWNVQRGSTSVQLAGTNYCLDAGSNHSNGVKGKIWTVSLASWLTPIGPFPIADVFPLILDLP
jgi:hypothetical protein